MEYESLSMVGIHLPVVTPSSIHDTKNYHLSCELTFKCKTTDSAIPRNAILTHEMIRVNRHTPSLRIRDNVVGTVA